MTTAAKQIRDFFGEDWTEPAPVIHPPEVDSSQIAVNSPSNPPAKRRQTWGFQPGKSGNPGGRKRKQPITDALMVELEREMPGADGKTVAQALAKRLVFIAAGKTSAAIRALEVILDRSEGKVIQRQELSGVDGTPMQFESLGSRQEVEQKIAILLMQADSRKSEGVTTSQDTRLVEEWVSPVTLSQPPVTTSQASVTTSQMQIPMTIEAELPVPVTTSQPLALELIPMEPIAGSSNVTAVGYDPAGSTLLVEYKGNSLYVWRGLVPASEWQALLKAESAGKYMRLIEAQFGAGERVRGGEMVPVRSQAVPVTTSQIDLEW